MKADIWMPLYVADYLADTNRLTTIQHGAYLLLLMDYWRNGALPDDDQILAQISKMHPDAWSIARAVLEQYFIVDNGFWKHKRVDAEMAKAGINKKTAHDRAVKAAAARWEKEKEKEQMLEVMHEAMHEALHEQCPSPSPSSITSKAIVPSKLVDTCPHEKIIELYHSTLPTMPSVKVWTEKRRKLLQARWREDQKRQDVDYWERFFGYVAKSDFLCGRTEKPFNCDLEWMLNASNFVKIIEGKYHAA